MRIGFFAGITPETTFGLRDLVNFAKDAEARYFRCGRGGGALCAAYCLRHADLPDG